MTLPLLLALSCSSAKQDSTPLKLPVTELPKPAGVVFVDRDPEPHIVEGTIAIRRAADESNVAEYRIYWGADDNAKVAAVATLAKTGIDLSHEIAPGTLVPKGATKFLVFAASATAEAMSGAEVTPIDNYARFVDVSKRLLSYADSMDPFPVVDLLGGKVMIAANDTSNEQKPVWIRCGLTNLSSCTYVYGDLQPTNSGLQLTTAFDATSNKLLTVTLGPGLHRCNPDGSGCTFTDISASQPRGSGWMPSAVVDDANGKLLVATNNLVNDEKPSLFRCGLDGTGCTHSDISAGQGAYSGQKPSLVVDKVNAKLFVATRNYANAGKPSVFRCNLDGTGCEHFDISAGQVAYSGDSPSAVIDVAGARLLVVTEDGSSGYKSTLFRCRLDGTECSHTDISAGQGAQSGWFPSAVVDVVNSKLLVVAQDGGNASTLALVRCELDGTSCRHFDISAGQQQARYPRAVIDTVNGRLLVTASMLDTTTGLFTIGLW